MINSGSLLGDLGPPILPPKEIEDPEDKKPADWDERAKIVFLDLHLTNLLTVLKAIHFDWPNI